MIPASTLTALAIGLASFPKPEPLPAIHADWRYVAPGSSCSPHRRDRRASDSGAMRCAGE